MATNRYFGAIFAQQMQHDNNIALIIITNYYYNDIAPTEVPEGVSGYRQLNYHKWISSAT